MTNHVLLDNNTHKELRISREYGAEQGDNVNVARAFPIEFNQLEMEYPLFFLKNSENGHFEALALLGFAEGENLYLVNNNWDASYVPLSIQRQPFLIGFQEREVDGVPTQVPVVHFDADHPSVNNSRGERVFLEHGGASPYLERINEVLMAIHEGNEASRSFSQILVGLDLIESLSVEIEFNDGSKQGLSGLYTINEEKLRALNADSLAVLHEKDYLRLIYLILASIPNLQKLIARKNRLLDE